MSKTQRQDTQKAFDALARKLAQVPKEQVDAKVATDKAKRIAKRKKK